MQSIERQIYIIRGHKVMFDSDLADLYGVSTGNLNKAVGRNEDRFPPDFMFRLTLKEYQILRFQFGILGWGNYSKYPPRVFTEQGVAMLSSVLRSKRAINANIAIMRAFVKLRQIIASHKGLAHRLNELEKKYDGHFKMVFEAIRLLIDEAEQPKRPLGFRP